MKNVLVHSSSFEMEETGENQKLKITYKKNASKAIHHISTLLNYIFFIIQKQ